MDNHNYILSFTRRDRVGKGVTTNETETRQADIQPSLGYSFFANPHRGCSIKMSPHRGRPGSRLPVGPANFYSPFLQGKRRGNKNCLNSVGQF